MLPDNICYDVCGACSHKWFENTETFRFCACGDIKLCSHCVETAKELEVMEHNMIDCDAKSCEKCEDNVILSTEQFCSDCIEECHSV